MSRYFYIVPECYADTNFIETLLDNASCNHQKGFPNVLKNLREAKELKDSFAIGIVDNDKDKPSLFYEYNLIAEGENLVITNHKDKPFHYLILIKPAIENFILKVAKEANINPIDYNVPDDLEKLKVKTKDVFAKTDPDLKRLFKKIRNNIEVRKLTEILKYLIDNKYSADLQHLKKIIEKRDKAESYSDWRDW